MVDISYPETGAEAMLEVEASSFWFRHRNDVLVGVLDRFAPGAEIWDIGGGNGYQAMMLQDAGRDVVMVEPGEKGCRNARRRGVKNVKHATLESLALPERSVAAFTLLDVVEHLPDPTPTLRECARALREDGKVVITVPAYDWLWSDEDDYARHQRRYSVPLLEEHLSAAGLRLEWSTYFFGALVLPILLLRALPYRLKGGKAGGGDASESDLSEHAPGGVSQKMVEILLRRELAGLRRGRTYRAGSSILAVASR